MSANTVICDNPRRYGAPCGEAALVHAIQYVLVKQWDAGQNETVHELRETHYQIHCPRCGERTQIESYNGRK